MARGITVCLPYDDWRVRTRARRRSGTDDGAHRLARRRVPGDAGYTYRFGVERPDLDRLDRFVERDLAGVGQFGDAVPVTVEADLEDIHPMLRAARGFLRKFADRQMVLAGDDDPAAGGRVDLAGEIDDPGAPAERALAGVLNARSQHRAGVDAHSLEQRQDRGGAVLAHDRLPHALEFFLRR